jgi:putative spermidine/putrescine transport system substrate-binding protein
MSKTGFGKLLWGAAALALISAVGLGSARAESSVTFVGWGGEGQDAMKKAWADPFEAATGIKVLQDSPTDYGKFKAMVESGNVTWDVVDVEGSFAYNAAAEGLLEPLDFTVIDKKDLDPNFVFDQGVGSVAWSWVLGYNKDALGDKVPQDWAALFDTKTYPGGRAITKWLAPGMLEAALLADGVAPDKLYPLDIDRAFKKFDSIKKDIVWWDSAAQSQQQLASGEASIGMFWNGRMHMLETSGAPVGVIWKDNLVTADFVVIPKGSPHKAEAMKLIAQIVSAQGQAAHSSLTAYGPVNKEAATLIPADVQPALPSSHTESQIVIDLDYWTKNLDAISKRWYEWQAQ